MGTEKPRTKLYKLATEAWLLVLCYKLYHKLPVESFWEFHYGAFPVLVILLCSAPLSRDKK